MIQIENTIVSFDIFEKKFSCDLSICKGQCCIDGDSGAPLEKDELKEIEDNFNAFKKYMKPEGLEAVKQDGFGCIDIDGDLVTPLIHGCECAYTIDENGSCWCAIEKAWFNGESKFRKPISCHLYPIRITKYNDFEAINFHKWKICLCARRKGEIDGTPIYKFVKDALIRRYGQEWYEQLLIAAREIENGNIKTF